MMMGRKNPKIPETAGGRTPETTANDLGDAIDHCFRNGTNAVSCQQNAVSRMHAGLQDEGPTAARLARKEMTKRGIVLKKQTATSQIMPSNLFRANSPSEAFIFFQI